MEGEIEVGGRERGREREGEGEGEGEGGREWGVREWREDS